LEGMHGPFACNCLRIRIHNRILKKMQLSSDLLRDSQMAQRFEE